MFHSRRILLTRIALIVGVIMAIIVVAGGLPGSASAAPACGATCYVNAVTGLDSNDGTSGSPFATIQFGVNSVDVGGTVHVAAGTYVELVALNKSVNLAGAGRAVTVIQAPSSANTISAVVKVTGTGVSAEISGFKITRPAGAVGKVGYGIYVRDDAFANIHDNEIVDIRDEPLSGGQHGQGINIGNNLTDTVADPSSGSAIIKNNIVRSFQKNGINIIGASTTATVEGNTIIGNGPVGLGLAAQNGIQVSHGATATITGNSISNISYIPSTYAAVGILLSSGGMTTISDNTLTNNMVGMYVIDTSATITGNDISATETGTQTPFQYGIFAYNATSGPMTVDIIDNIFTSNNAKDSLAVGAAAGYGAHPIDLEISDNLISNWDYGVAFECDGTNCGAGFSPLVIDNNSITGNNNGIDTVVGVPVNAENNWWGDSSGPSGQGPGTGDSVSNNVDFDPFLTTNPQPTKVNLSSTDQLVCGPDSASVNIDFSNVPNIYGYQFEVTYEALEASATGAFVNDWFDTSGALVPPGWGAVCAGGVCKFAASLQAPTPPSGGGGPVATVNFTSLAPGTFSAQVTNVKLTDIDGFIIPFTSDTASLSFDVCGNAAISGAVSLQGRVTPLDAGQVKLIDQGGNFPDIVVPFSDTTGAFSIPNVPVMPNGSDYLMQATHILYVGTQKSFTGVNNLAPALDHLMPGEVLTNQNTRLWGGDADNSSVNAPFTVGVDITDIGCISNAFGGAPVACGTTDPTHSSTDINKDGVTNIQDLALAGGNYGKNPYQPW